MAISPTITTGPYTGNGATTQFAFDFTVTTAADLYVTVNNLTVSASTYIVALGSAGTGTVTFSVPPANGASILIYSQPDWTQETYFENDGAYTLSAVNSGNRRDAIRSNWLARMLTKIVPTGWQLPANLAGKYLAFDAQGAPTLASGTGNDSALRTDLASSASGALLVAWKSSGTGAVLRTLWARLFDLPISVKDFGAVGDGVTNDTTPIQNAITFAQLTKAWLYFPPVINAYMVSGLTVGTTGKNDTCHFMGGGFDPSMAAQTGITGQYTGQSQIKLIAGSNTSLITVGVDAAQPMFKHMTLNGNGSAQSGTSYCLNFGDASAAAYYRYSGWMRDCLIVGGRSGGLFIGLNRGAGYFENVWVQYNGTTTADAAVNVRCFDQQFKSFQVGPNVGIGMYLGTGTQIQISDSVFFLNNVGLQVTTGIGAIQVTSSAFDSNATYGCDVAGGGSVDGARQFTGCHWHRNGTATNNTYSDIRVDSDRRISLVAPAFTGKENGSNVVKYNIEFLSSTQQPFAHVISPMYEAVTGNTYGTAFTNAYSDLMLLGSRDAYIGKPGGNQSISAVINDLQRFTVDATGTKVFAKFYLPKDDGGGQVNTATYGGSGVPSNANGANGDFYFRSDTPGTANQRLYVKSAGAWVGIV